MTAADCVLLTDDFLPHIGGSRVYYDKVAGILASCMTVVTRKRGDSAAFDSGVAYTITRVSLAGAAFPLPAAIGEAADCLALATAASRVARSARCILAGEVTPSAFAAGLVALRLGIPYGVFVHDEPLMGAGALERMLRMRVLSRAAALIASSSFAARRAHEAAPRVPVFLAPAGVDLDRFSPGEPSVEVMNRFRVAPRSYLLSVGRLVPYKNVSLLIRAIASLNSPCLSLVVAGEGPDRAALAAEAASLGVSDRVIFTGRVPETDLVHLYRGALVYVFPSRRQGGLQHEGIGMAALEAVASGALAMASTDTSASDFLADGRTGFLFDPDDLEAFVRLVQRVIDSPAESAAIAARGTDLVRREFTWPHAASVVSQAIDFLTGRAPLPDASLVKNPASQSR